MSMAAKHPRTTRRSVVAVLGVLGVGSLVACSAPGGSAPVSSNTSPPSAVSTDIGTAPVTLKLYDGQGLKAIDDALIAAFTKKYPNVTITPHLRPGQRDDPESAAPAGFADASGPGARHLGHSGHEEQPPHQLGHDATGIRLGQNPPASQLAQFRAANGVAGARARSTRRPPASR